MNLEEKIKKRIEELEKQLDIIKDKFKRLDLNSREHSSEVQYLNSIGNNYKLCIDELKQLLN